MFTRMKTDKTMMNEKKNEGVKKREKIEREVIKKLWVSVRMEPARRRRTGLGGCFDCRACS